MNAQLKVGEHTELAPLDRAERVLGFVERKAQLAELATKSHRIVQVIDSASYAECHGARMPLKAMRVEIQKAGKLAREDATAFSKAVIAKEKELIDVIAPEEQRLQALQDAWDAARQAEKDAIAAVEKARLDAITEKINTIHSMPLQAVGKSASAIHTLLESVRCIDPSFAAEQADYATRVRDEVVATLSAIHAQAVEAEAEAARLAAERAELAQLRAEQEARQAEESRQAAAARAEADRLAQIERDRLDAEMREKMRIEAADRAQAEAAIRAEREAAEAALRAERDAAEAKARAERVAAELIETERLRAEAQRVRLEREELDRQKAEAERVRMERELAEVTLVAAATEARDLLVSEGRAHHPVTMKLTAALAREQFDTSGHDATSST
ncbi:MAG: hypothetical protein ACYCOR_20985 [Acidobacteriaceae bacterium]